MAFPQAIIDAQVELNLAGTWTPITSYTYVRDGPVTITRGRPDEATACNPGTAPMSWNNRDGRFSPRNPAGPYYGSLGRNTPVRISVPDNVVFLRIEDDDTSFASAPDAAGLHITGNIDMRIDCDLSGYQPCSLAAKYLSSGSERSWAFVLNGDGTLGFWWSTDGTLGNTTMASSTAAVPLGRTALRVTLTASTGTVTFYTGAAGGADGSTWTQLGATVVTGSTSIFSSTSSVRVGHSAGVSTDETTYGGLTGKVYEYELRNSSGTVVAHPVFSSQTPGASSFADAQSNTWTMSGTSVINGRSYRFHGECSSLPQQWDVTGADVFTPVAAAGLLRRMGQGNAPLNSAIKRAFLAQGSQVAAYWPCEDLQGATMIASALGGPPMTVSGVASFASDTDFACSNPLPQVGSSIWRGQVPAYSGGTANVMYLLLDVPAGGLANNTILAKMYTNGTVTVLDLVTDVNGDLSLNGYNAAGNALFTNGFAFGINGQQLLVQLVMQTSGAQVEAVVTTLALGAPSATTFNTATTGGATLGNVTGAAVNPHAAALGSTAIGHVCVQTALADIMDLAEPFNAWVGETAGNRFSRLCSENSFACRVYGFPDVSVAMGPQSADTLTDLLQECEDADKGMIYEPRGALALGYRTQASLLNQPVALTLDYPSKQIGDGSSTAWGPPTDDDQYTMNDMTLTRGSAATSGSSFQATLDDGSPMSISAPPDGVGDYSNTATQNLASDEQLPDGAWWLVHLGTVNESRYPVLPLNLARSQLSSLFFPIQDVELGQVVEVTDPPGPQLAPDPVKQVVTQSTEQLGGFVWSMAWNCVPETPYETGLYDDAAYGRADTSGSTLHTTATSGATSLSVSTTTAGDALWTTVAADFPFNIIIGGEVMTVTAVSGSSSPQTFTVTRSVNGVVKAQASGQDVRLHPAPVYAML